MVVDVQPVELSGKFWVNVSIGGSAMEPRGPFPNADEAEAMAGRLSRAARALTSGGSTDG